jgi:ribosomal protein S18 acetylase RimI-like enzyme
MRALTSAGYQLTERFYCLSRTLEEPVEEVLPGAELSLVYGGTAEDRTYQLYRRTDWVGSARVVTVRLESAAGLLRLAKLLHIEVDPAWRGMDIGKWLVKRIINDCTLQGYPQLLVYAPHSRQIAVALFNQLGFVEENYRGYTLEKTLTS